MSRSKSGCWTCRLWTKKKCDETKPTCKRCAGLGVHCFGYGSRPSEGEVGRDRRAVIASIGGVSRKEDSTFRVWRLKPKPVRNAPRPAGSGNYPSSTSAERERKNRSNQSYRDDTDTTRSHTTSLVALDRVNSDMLDFLHPQLLADYTDNVFWLDSRFYKSPGPYEGNSWMKSFLSRSKETHLAAALMGLTWRRWQDDTSRLISIDFTRPLVLLHSLVLQSVKEEIERSQKLVNNEDILKTGSNLAKCVSILLIFEVWRTLEGDWLTHLHGMSEILRWLQSRIPSALDAAMKIEIGEFSTDELSDSLKAAPAPDMIMNYLTLKWFGQCYAWNDITAALWIGPRYARNRLNCFYSPLLKHGHLRMDRFMGCEDLVLFAISEIVNVEDRMMYTPDHFEMEQLVNEAADWDQILNSRLRTTVLQRYEYPPGLERDATFVTEMWIYAALVYLHIVMFGSQLNHPKLRAYVFQSLKAYLNLPRRLDIHIAMPFGVLASMANDEEAQQFLGIAEPQRAIEEINPGQRKTFKIVKECCAMRRKIKTPFPDAGVSWRDAARQLGLTVLPV